MKVPFLPLRIAFFHDLPSGGAKRTVHAQIRELVRRGHRVEAFLPSTAEEEFFQESDRRKQKKVDEEFTKKKTGAKKPGSKKTSKRNARPIKPAKSQSDLACSSAAAERL